MSETIVRPAKVEDDEKVPRRRSKKVFVRITCDFCGEEFSRYDKQVRKTRNFCSRECRSGNKVGKKVDNKSHREKVFVHLTCDFCGKGFDRYDKQVQKTRNFCSHKCSVEYRVGKKLDNKPHMKGYYYVNGYKFLSQQYDHPLTSPSSGSLAEHRKVLYDVLGPGTHECHWCGEELEWGGRGGICVDHLDWNRANNDPSNLVPSCYVCNLHRHEGKK